MSIWITGAENKSIDHGSLETDPVSVNLREGWSFNGLSDYVSFADHADLTFPDADWSFGGWIKPVDNGEAAAILFSWNYPTHPSILPYLNMSTLKIWAYWNDGTDNINTDLGDFVFGAWQHILFVRTGTSLKLYVDGRETGSTPIGNVDAVNGAGAMYAGVRTALDIYWYEGEMSNWAKWDSALAKADRVALAGGIDARVVDTGNQKWCCPMKRGDYSVVGDTFAVTNNGTSDGTAYTATLTASINCAGLKVYQGTFDADTYGLTLRGDTLLANNSVLFGNQTWDVSGDFDDQELDAHTAETSTLKLTGATKTLSRPTTGSGNYFENVWITGSYTMDTGHLQYDGDATVDGSLSLGSGLSFTGYFNADLDINGTVTGLGQISMYGMYAAHGIVGNDGTLTCANLYIDDPEATSVFDPGDYSGLTGILYIRDRTTWAGDSTLKFAAGTFTFGDIVATTQGADDLYFDCTNNPTIIFTGDYSEVNDSTGVVYWTPGASDTITFSGSDDQDIGFSDCIGNVVVNKSGGTLTLTANLCCASLDIQDGNFDANGYNVTINGDFTLTNLGDTLTMGSGTWECSGNVNWVGCGTIAPETSVLKLTGSGKTLDATVDAYCRNLWITGSYTIPVTTGWFGANAGTVTIDGTLTSNNGFAILVGTLDLNVGGTVTGSGYMNVHASSITTLDGTWDTAIGYISEPLAWTNTFAPGTIACAEMRIRAIGADDRGIRYDSGTHIYTGNVIFRCYGTGNLTVDTTTNSPIIDFRGNLGVLEDSTGQVIFA